VKSLIEYAYKWFWFLKLILKFQQHFTSSFSANSLLTKCNFSKSKSYHLKNEKAAHKKVLPGVNFTNMFTSSFYAPRSQKHKKTVKSPVSFCIPKAQKKTDNLTVFSALSGSALVKAASKKIVKIVTWAQFHQHSTYSFYACRSQKHKKTLMTSLYFLRFRDLRVQKLYKERWWNWHLIVKKLVKLLPDCKVSFKSESNNQKNWSTHRDVHKGHRKSSHISPQT